MQMNDIINELNACDTADYSAAAMAANNNAFGCGFGSWIWILLILFYTTQGACGTTTATNNCCCATPVTNNCCCCNNANTANNGLFGGIGNCGGGYLFLLVILFLCNGGCGCNGQSNYSGLCC